MSRYVFETTKESFFFLDCSCDADREEKKSASRQKLKRLLSIL